MITFSCPYCGQFYEMEDASSVEGEIQCQVCGETFQPPVPDENESLLLKPKIPVRHPAPEAAPGPEPEEEPDTPDRYAGYGSLAGPLTRFAARSIDMEIEEIVFAMPLGALLEAKGIGSLQSSLYLEMVFCTVASLLLDSVIYAVFRNTLGRWLMGERIINEKMEKITPFEYFIRNIKVFFFGFGACIPIFNLIANYVQCKRVWSGESASYDVMPGFSVVEYDKRWYKTLIGIIILLASVAMYIGDRILMNRFH